MSPPAESPSTTDGLDDIQIPMEKLLFLASAKTIQAVFSFFFVDLCSKVGHVFVIASKRNLKFC